MAAFERLYRRHAARVFSLARRMLGAPDRAEDATQEIFLKAWQALPSFRGEAPFGAWLARLARNELLNAIRRRHRRPPEGAAAPAREPTARAPWPVAGGVEATARADVLALEAVIASLPDGARRVLVLYHFEGFTHAEIAAALEISVGTSKSQLARARSLLRAALEPPRHREGKR